MIQGIMLIDGQEIIAETEEAINGNWILTNPYRIEIIDDYDQPGSRLVNVLTLSKNNSIVIKSEHIISFYEPKDSVVEYYNKMLEVSTNTNFEKSIENSIKELKNMENTMKERISQMFIRGKTVN